jgi:hypothetical protein
VAANVTAVSPTGAGYLNVWPGDLPMPVTSSLNFMAHRTRANHALLPLGRDGSVLMQPLIGGSGGSGAMHLVIDVFGYFE